jgi:hypothetical protein
MRGADLVGMAWEHRRRATKVGIPDLFSAQTPDLRCLEQSPPLLQPRCMHQRQGQQDHAAHTSGDMTGDWAAGPRRLPPAPHRSAVRAAAAQAHRLLGRHVVLLLLLFVGFVGCDRLAAAVVTSRIVGALADRGQLAGHPTVRVGGFPFLTQVAAGRYADVEVSIPGLVTPGPRLDRVHVHLHGVHLGFGALIRHRTGPVLVDRLTASASVTYADLNAFLRRQPGSLQVSADGGAIQVRGTLPGPFGLTVPADASARVDVSHGLLTINPVRLGVAGIDSPPIPDGLLPAFRVQMPVGLPYGLRLTSAQVHTDRVTLAATAGHLVLPVAG